MYTVTKQYTSINLYLNVLPPIVWEHLYNLNNNATLYIPICESHPDYF